MSVRSCVDISCVDGSLLPRGSTTHSLLPFSSSNTYTVFTDGPIRLRHVRQGLQDRVRGGQRGGGGKQGTEGGHHDFLWGTADEADGGPKVSNQKGRRGGKQATPPAQKTLTHPSTHPLYTDTWRAFPSTVLSTASSARPRTGQINWEVGKCRLRRPAHPAKHAHRDKRQGVWVD